MSSPRGVRISSPTTTRTPRSRRSASSAASIAWWSVMHTTSRPVRSTRSANWSSVVTASPERTVCRWQSTRTQPEGRGAAAAGVRRPPSGLTGAGPVGDTGGIRPSSVLGPGSGVQRPSRPLGGPVPDDTATGASWCRGCTRSRPWRRHRADLGSRHRVPRRGRDEEPLPVGFRRARIAAAPVRPAASDPATPGGDMSTTSRVDPYEGTREEAVAWLKENWDPQRTVRGWWAVLAESGWGFPTWPTEWFGRDLDPVLAGAVREAFGEVGALGPPSSLG